MYLQYINFKTIKEKHAHNYIINLFDIILRCFRTYHINKINIILIVKNIFHE